METTIPTEPLKRKLKNLGQYLPCADETLCLFAEYLSEKLDPEVTPKNLMLTTNFALQDLQQKSDRHGGEINSRYNSLAGQDMRYYENLFNQLPEIVQAIFPNDFTKDFDQSYKKLKEKAISGQFITTINCIEL